MTKKGISLGINTMIKVAIVILVLLSGIWIWQSWGVQTAALGLGPGQLKNLQDTCEQIGRSSDQFRCGDELFDKDNDCQPDFCDICVYSEGQQRYIGDNELDSDKPTRDYMPDACDEDPNDPKKFGCGKDKGLKWKTGRYPRCVWEK